MSNVLDNEKQQQILALGRLGWSLRRIEQALAVRRETISGYLKPPGSRCRAAAEVRADRRRCPPDPRTSKPAISEEVSTDSGRQNRLDEVAGLDRDELTGYRRSRS